MKQGIVVLAVLAALVIAPAAQAHNSHGWWWKRQLAERAIESHYGNIDFAACTGEGAHIRSKGGSKLYKHFICGIALTDGGQRGLLLHVLGRPYRFTVSDITVLQ